MSGSWWRPIVGGMKPLWKCRIIGTIVGCPWTSKGIWSVPYQTTRERIRFHKVLRRSDGREPAGWYRMRSSVLDWLGDQWEWNAHFGVIVACTSFFTLLESVNCSWQLPTRSHKISGLQTALGSVRGLKLVLVIRLLTHTNWQKALHREVRGFEEEVNSIHNSCVTSWQHCCGGGSLLSLRSSAAAMACELRQWLLSLPKVATWQGVLEFIRDATDAGFPHLSLKGGTLPMQNPQCQVVPK